MIWTLQFVTIFMTVMSDVSTLSLERIKQEIDYVLPKVSSEEYSKPLRHIDPTNIHLSTSPQNHTANHEYNATQASDKKKVSGVDVHKPFDNLENKSSKKLHDVEQGAFKLLTTSQPLGVHTSGVFKSIGANTENYPTISNQHTLGMKTNNFLPVDKNNHPWKINEGFKLYPQMKITESGSVKSEGSTGVESLPHQTFNFNGRKTYQLSFLDFINDKKVPHIINTNQKKTSNKDLTSTRGVFPEDNFSQDVLASVQKEFFHGFPKGKNQNLIFENATVKSTSEHSLETISNLNTLMATEKYGYKNNKLESTTTEDVQNDSKTEKYAETSSMFIDEIEETQTMSTLDLTTETNADHDLSIQSETNSNMNIESQTEANAEVYSLNGENISAIETSTEFPKKFVNKIEGAQVPSTEEDGKFSYSTEAVALNEQLESKHSELKRLDYQKQEDDMRIRNAKYKFSTSQKDGISDLLHYRSEMREDGKVTGSYTYSDGFLLRIVKYVADKNGYRIVSEESVPLPGNGPKVNPEGTAHVITDVGGHPVQYVVHGRELSHRTSHRQGKHKI